MINFSTLTLTKCVRLVLKTALWFLLLVSIPSFGSDEPWKLMAWNVEHLNEENNAGCVPRVDSDYVAITTQINEIRPDVVAFQEIETAKAAARIFSPETWDIVFSSRPNTGPLRECWQQEGKYLRHLGTGFAIRKGIEYVRNQDFDSLGLDDKFQRWGTDITLKRNGKSVLRILSIHLRSGCWGPPQDEQNADACPQLHQQSKILANWVKSRSEDDLPFAILGDFNRRLAIKDDWMWADLNLGLSSGLHLLDQGIEAKCNPRYKDFIDHIVLDHRAFATYVKASFTEVPRTGEHPDHCAITALFNL